MAVDEFGEDSFTAMIGAEAIHDLLAVMELEKIAGDLRSDLASTTSELKQKEAAEASQGRRELHRDRATVPSG